MENTIIALNLILTVAAVAGVYFGFIKEKEITLLMEEVIQDHD